MSELKKALAVTDKASSSSEVKPKVKTEGRAKSQEPKPRAKAKAKAGAQSDDDLELTGIKPNNSTDMKFWIEKNNANNYRKELMIRYPDRYLKEWAFKSREQLLKIVEELMKNNQWIIEDTEK
jgi:hypothetical protein